MEPSLYPLILEATRATRVQRAERVQSLWGGYGELLRVHLLGGATETVILKHVTPKAAPRGAEEARSHARKLRSYEVELAFYKGYAARTDERCRVAAPLAVSAKGGRTLLLLEDLDAAGFPARQGRRTHDLTPCLRWLAAFHARFLGARPDGLWREGTYWHLGTRPDELARTGDLELREAAPVFDRALAGARFRTLVHGDAKPANFCFSPDGQRVAAVDFQYVGGGCGVKDVAYLLHGEVPPREEAALLDGYFAALREALEGTTVEVAALEAEWRALYPVARADFIRFLAGWAGSYDASGRAAVREALHACS